MSRKKSQSVVDFLYDRESSKDVLLGRRFLSDRLSQCRTLYKRNLEGHFGCVNAIEFSNNGGDFLASGGDDRRVLLWNIQHAMSNGKEKEYSSMKGEHHSNIFSVAFDSHNTKIFSGGNDDQVLVHDMQTGDTRDVFLHEDAVYGLAVDPRNDSVFASACADGRVLLWDTRVSSQEEPFALGNYSTAFHAVVYHPMEPCLLATANAKEGVALWDVRAPRTCLMRYGSSHTHQNAMSVRFNQTGSRMVALRRRLPPVVYNIQSSVAAVQFDHSGYYNSCTMKSCCFAGDKDQYIVSGSDDFNLYMWRVPEQGEEKGWVPKAQIVMTGHRSIVNQVRFNPYTSLVASSGVEKVVKIWSPFCAPRMTDCDEQPRRMFSHQQYINLVINSGTVATGLAHDYSTQSIDEDPRMIAFFDSLVQREVDRSFSDSDDSELSPDSLYMNFAIDSGDSSQDSDSDESISSFQASLIRMSQIANDNEDDDSDDSDTNVRLFSSKKRKLDRISSSDDSSDDSASKKHKDDRNQDRQGTSNDGQNNNGAKTDSSSGTKRKSTHTSSEESSSSDEEDEMRDLQDTRLKSRIMRRFAARSRHKKIKGSLSVSDNAETSPHRFRRMQTQLDHDRMINLRQRWAYCKALKARMAKSKEEPRPVTRVPNEDNLDIIAEHLDRTASRESRTAISKLRRRVLMEEMGSTQGSSRMQETSRSSISFNRSSSIGNIGETSQKSSRLKSQKCSNCNQDNNRCSCTEKSGQTSRKRGHRDDSAGQSSHSASKYSRSKSSDGDSQSSHNASKSSHSASKSSHGASKSSHSASKSSHSASKSGHGASKSSHSASKASHSASKSSHGASKSSHSANKSSHSASKSSHGASKSTHSASKSSHSASKSCHSAINSSHIASKSSDSSIKSSHSTSKSSHTASKSSHNDSKSSHSASKSSHSAGKSSHTGSKCSHDDSKSSHSARKSIRHTGKSSGESSNTKSKPDHGSNTSGSEAAQATTQNMSHLFKSRKAGAKNKRQYRSHSKDDHTKQKEDSESD